ncbi:MAG: leucine-rich repeat domain-containing protein [Clostridia bacterium]|nr:leucine-rich repeat domain-containing protein [Clostridia bacterium]
MAKESKSKNGKNIKELKTVNGVEYAINNDGTATVYEQSSGEIDKFVKIEDAIRDSDGRVCKVTEIGYQAFASCDVLETIEIPDGIIEIGEWAFSGCDNLRTVKLSNSIRELKKSTFYDCYSLQTIVIPDSVTRIGDSAFYGCKKLSDLILPESLNYIGASAFDECINLKSMFIAATVIHIGDHAFDHCDSLEDIQVDPANAYYYGDGIRLIEKSGNKVLYKCKNKVGSSTEIPSKEEKKEKKYKSFADGKKVKDMLSKDEYTYFLGSDYTAAIVEYNNKDAIPKCLQIPAEIDDGDGVTYKIKELYSPVFFYKQQLEEVEIPEGVEIIGENVFAECRNLTRVSLPTTLKQLGARAFSGCKKLAQINMNNNMVKTIEKDAFFGCDGLESFALGDFIEEIEERAFGCCKNLSELSLPCSLKKIGSRAFCHCDKLRSIYIPSLVNEINGDVFQGCHALESLVVDSENNKYYSDGNCIIEKSANRVVAACPTSKIPFGITEIAERAFYGSQIRYLNIPESVVKIGDHAFAWSGLYEIYIPNSVVEIGDGAFDDCYARLRCGAKEKPEGWSQYMGLKKINFTLWNYPVPIDIKPIIKKESIFKKIKKLFAKIFGKK